MKLRPNNFKESPGQYARGEFSRRHFSVLHKLTVRLPSFGPAACWEAQSASSFQFVFDKTEQRTLLRGS